MNKRPPADLYRYSYQLPKYSKTVVTCKNAKHMLTSVEHEGQTRNATRRGPLTASLKPLSAKYPSRTSRNRAFVGLTSTIPIDH